MRIPRQLEIIGKTECSQESYGLQMLKEKYMARVWTIDSRKIWEFTWPHEEFSSSRNTVLVTEVSSRSLCGSEM